MQHVISDLVSRFEGGRLSRRELIQALTAVAATAGATASAASLKAGSINHTSVLVSDMARSIDFYNRVFGLSVANEDKANKISRLGVGVIPMLCNSFVTASRLNPSTPIAK